jgi:hypothetical protein
MKRMMSLSLATRSRSSALVVSLALGLLPTACASSGDDDGRSTEQTCEPTAEDYLTEALASERALVTRGRADAAFDQAFGDESQVLLDDADAQRAELIEQAAADLGLELPDAGAVSSCAGSAVDVTWEPLSVSFLLAFGITASSLREAVRTAPMSGTIAGKPYTSTSKGTAADGSPKTTVTTLNITTSGHDSVVTVTTTMSSEVTTGAGTTRESAYVAASADVCPDPGGVARGNITTVLDGSVGDSSSYHADSNQSFDFIVNDQASIASTEITSSLSYRATGGKREADVSVKGTASFVGESDTVKEAQGTTERWDGSPESEKIVHDNLFTFAFATASMVRADAEKKWRGGKCVEIVVEPPSQLVDAEAEVEVTARPRHKLDMSNVDATVVTSLKGVKSLDKQGQRVAAPATYHYVAGSDPNDRGTLELKSTSKRGIAEAVVTYTVRCDENMECPEGKTLNLETCQCECSEVMDCPKGQAWDGETCACVCEPEQCAANETWDSEQCECVCDRECPSGTALNEATCRCEESCEIDPMLGNTSAECAWEGTFNLSMSDSGTVDLSSGQAARTVTWATTYGATAHPAGSGLGGMFTLQGSASGDWAKTDVTTYPEPSSCMLTESETASVQSELGSDAYGAVVPVGDGTLSVVLSLGQQAYLMGSHELVGSADPCTGADPSELSLGIPGLMGSGAPSRDAFSGSSDTELAIFSLPDGRYATFHLSWSLHLVRR